ncbi:MULTISPECIES: glutamine amidotransferase-related protein [unclassified Schaalia]|uniref:glutamine amidotransferase-related protein n=1 Tax=unclassified Schaalia TaxID=2691889 RepID=UPI001E4EB8FE|nr:MULTISPECIES: glutamine amidotransferase [unclassified Schaalia]MCD4548848.1 glutamine amidotransferase [Schaalia sp. lx-260]MCD4557464.1 glutamine amidotransferase [Schaalia sp. lx-100]
MLPFLLVSTRPEDEAVESEYRCFMRVTGLETGQLEQVRLDMVGLPDIDVHQYAGIIVAGSPYGTTTPDERKTPTQKRTETELTRIFTEIFTHNIPCLTTGFGTEVAAVLRGGVVTKKWGEHPQITDIFLTEAGQHDPLLQGFPCEFPTYVDHREAVEHIPENAVVLAKSLDCPVQMMRLGEFFWATQFNPELDSDAISARLQSFLDAGYPGTDDIESLVWIGRNGTGTHQGAVLIRRFIDLCRKR